MGKENLGTEETPEAYSPRGLKFGVPISQHFTTSMACKPFFPWAISNSTSSPS